MSKQCPVCAAVCSDDDAFCVNCGSGIAEAPVQPAAPRRRARPEKPIIKVVRTIMRYIPFILMAFVIFTLLLSIMNFSGGFKVNVTATGTFGEDSRSETQSMKLSEIYEAEAFVPLALSGLAYGLYNLILTVLAVIMLVKLYRGNRKMRRSIGRYSLMGIIGSVVYLILVWITGTRSETAMGITLKATVAPHFTVWLSIVLFALLYALNFLNRKKRSR